MGRRRNKQAGNVSAKRERRRATQARPGDNSNYARKRKWLHAHGMWGFDVPEPKPWRGAS